MTASDTPPVALASLTPGSDTRHIVIKGHPLCDPGTRPYWYKIGTPGRICTACRLYADLIAKGTTPDG